MKEYYFSFDFCSLQRIFFLSHQSTSMKKAATYFIVLGMSVVLSSCSSYSRSNMPGLQKDKSEIYHILRYASLAGSSHNSQPWRTEVFGMDSILVFVDNSRKLPVVDPTSREQYISVGAFIENLKIAASCFGYHADILIHSHAVGSSAPVASVLLKRINQKNQAYLLKDIELRTTLRSVFDTSTVRQTDWMALVSEDAQNIHFLPAESEQGRYVKQKELESFTQQACNKNAQDELATWIRFSNKDAAIKQDGLTTASMDIQGLGGFIVRNFYKPADSKKESFVKQGIEKTKLQVENCGGWIVITQPSESSADWINAGRLYQSVHLKCRRLHIGFHPMNQILEDSYSELDANNFMGYQGKIIFIARIGYVKDYPAPVSVRRPVEQFNTFM